VNCTATCNTGLCRRPAHRKVSLREPFPEETDQVWTEAGFLPPAGCRRTVALLHRLAMDEEPVASLLSPDLIAAAVKSGEAGCEYRIFDPARLRLTALEYGIDPADKSSIEIARAVTLAIIADYGEKTPEEYP